jgi:hypothetical protein
MIPAAESKKGQAGGWFEPEAGQRRLFHLPYWEVLQHQGVGVYRCRRQMESVRDYVYLNPVGTGLLRSDQPLESYRRGSCPFARSGPLQLSAAGPATPRSARGRYGSATEASRTRNRRPPPRPAAQKSGINQAS